MDFKGRVSKIENSIKNMKKAQQGGLLLVFTDVEAGTEKIYNNNNLLFFGTIEEGDKFIQNLDYLVVILPSVDPIGELED